MRTSEAAFESDDTEITLGAGKLLGLFFLLAMVCGVFFSIGYSLGKSSGREQAMNDQAANAVSAPASGGDTASKPSAALAKSDNTSQEDATKAQSESELGFYKAVQKNEPDTQLKSGEASSAAASKPVPAAAPAKPEPSQAVTQGSPRSEKTQLAANNTALPVSSRAAAASSNFVVQIAAVSHEEDAVALAGALRKKNYNVFVLNYPAVSDKLYHVQVGPFASLQEAEAMKDKLTSDGYNPIVKR